MMTLIACYLVIAPIVEGPIEALIASVFIIAGIPVYYALVRGYFKPEFLVNNLSIKTNYMNVLLQYVYSVDVFIIRSD